VRFLLGEEPSEVSGNIYSTPGDPRFREVEENVAFTLRFPSGVLANCGTGYGSYNAKRYRVYAETGWIQMDPAFTYHGLKLEHAHAIEGTENKAVVNMADKNQFALEMDHFSECVKENKQPYTPGEEGLQDQRIMEAIYQSAKDGGKPVKLPAVAKQDAFRGSPPVASK
jgi:predicted dehydrogenase